MRFYMPVKVLDGPDCVKACAGEWVRPGRKALIVTGKNSAKACGALGDVLDALAAVNGVEAAGSVCCIFDGIEENPSVETVFRAAEAGLAAGAEYVIGIGGGSALDAAKAAAFLMKLPEEVRAEGEAALYDASLPSDALDVIAVPTTCGTGSEVTGVSVLTRHSKKTKASIPQRIFPKYALIDGKYLKSASHGLMVNTSVDALAHMVESWLSRKSDTYSRAAVLSGLDIWSGIRDVLSGDRSPDESDLSALMRASAFAGMAIAQTGTSIPHALSYPVTYNLKMPHGMACGYFLPAFLAQAEEEDREILLDHMGFETMTDFGMFIRHVLREPAVPEEILALAYDTVAANEARLQGCRFHADREVLRRIVYGQE